MQTKKAEGFFLLSKKPYLHPFQTAAHYLTAIADASPAVVPTEQHKLSKSSVAAAKYRPSDPRVFDKKKFQLEPTLNVLGDYTPKVETVLGWMKITQADKSIPAFTHMLITDNLERAMRSADSIALWLAKLSTTDDESMPYMD